GWNPPCTVRSFHVLTSVESISSCGQLIIPAGYWMTGNAYVLMAWTLFLPLSCLGPVSLSGGIGLTSLPPPHHGSHWPVGYPGTCKCAILPSGSSTPSVLTTSLFLSPFSCTYPVRMTS
ncbi:hypothetical protein LDENG_00297840, partial [Lucifuga dentata]